ncbi:hypothetical protein FGIG_03339 [Fasciola gigantica]|uniref:Uncharacterized protein n=1 Tax=Fasciola gigantica TaxID=46835 RepID=A0A504YL71_FASGI|nr:hypothetical protein FGIG_03339 [Fasciola gigantica]
MRDRKVPWKSFQTVLQSSKLYQSIRAIVAK